MPDRQSSAPLNDPWLGLVIGNTRLHWASFRGTRLEAVWHTPHGSAEIAQRLIQQQFAATAWQSLPLPFQASTKLSTLGGQKNSPQEPPSIALYCASVVPPQTALWAHYPGFHAVHLDALPLANLYPTLGIDRALNLLGGGDRYGWPILVVDAGTALTFTTGDAGRLLGGAILPGLSTQFAALAQNTVTLPAIQAQSALPPRWSANTPDAVRSGIIYGLLATLQDFLQVWYAQYPQGQAVLTGGDAPQISAWLAALHPDVKLPSDAHLAFWGLCCYRQHQLTKAH